MWKKSAGAECEPGNRLNRLQQLRIEVAGCPGTGLVTAIQGAKTVDNQDLKKAGLKVTLPRMKILQQLASSKSRHLSAEDIYKSLLDAGEDVGLATVYRVLTQFEQAGIVLRHNFEGGSAVFELADEEHHDHMVCLESGEVIEFMDEVIEERQHMIADKYGFDIVDHSLVLYVKAKKK